MPKFLNYREESRKQYGITPESESKGVTLEQLQVGALLRIADATELMAKNFLALQAENKRLQESLNYWRAEHGELSKRYSAQKGVITKMKKKSPMQ